ncbi:MAG: hypothetical protein ACI3XA_04815 [Clostridia bacterium]
MDVLSLPFRLESFDSAFCSENKSILSLPLELESFDGAFCSENESILSLPLEGKGDRLRWMRWKINE